MLDSAHEGRARDRTAARIKRMEEERPSKTTHRHCCWQPVHVLARTRLLNEQTRWPVAVRHQPVLPGSHPTPRTRKPLLAETHHCVGENQTTMHPTSVARYHVHALYRVGTSYGLHARHTHRTPCTKRLVRRWRGGDLALVLGCPSGRCVLQVGFIRVKTKSNLGTTSLT